MNKKPNSAEQLSRRLPPVDQVLVDRIVSSSFGDFSPGARYSGWSTRLSRSNRQSQAETRHAVKSMARYTAPRRDYQLVINQLYNQYPQYRIFQDNLPHNRSRNDPTAKRYRIDGDRGIVLDDMKDFIIQQLYPEFKNKMKIGFTCIFKKPGRAEPSDQRPQERLEVSRAGDLGRRSRTGG